MTKLERIFDELEDAGVTCFESIVPENGYFSSVYREADEIDLEDLNCETAWLFSDSLGQALAID